MKRNKQLEKWALGISVTILIILVIVMMVKVSDLQGNARVINYAGIARGATQRLIKQEMATYENDELIHTLDDILEELLTGIGNNNLSLLKDSTYHSKLTEQVDIWVDLKEQIYITRLNKDNLDNLYKLSEEYYEFANDTVDAAEKYAAKSALFLRNLEIIIIVVSLVIILTILLMVYDIIFLSRLNRNLNMIAYIDVLTGLPNRTSCEIKMSEPLILSEGLEICCFMFDLNNLKITNDLLGHTAGDELITSFASILKSSAPERMFIGRYGGDEFIGILNDTTEEEVRLYINALLDNAKKHNENGNDVKISFAYGYAMSSSFDENTIKELLAQADMKMYERKASMKQ